MLPEILTLKGFLSYRKRQTLDFRKFHVALISGENGQGKSSLLDALTFALFSKARGIEGNRSGIDDVVTNGENYMEVSFQFVQNGTRYRIVRTFNKLKRHSDVRLEKENGDRFVSISEGAIRETDEKIKNILGMDYDAFVTSSFIMQGKADFFTVKKKEEKIEILRQILGLELYEKAKQKALDEINTINGEIFSIKNEITHLEEEIKEIESIKTATAEALKTLKALKEKKEKIEKELKKIREKYSELKVFKEKLDNTEQKISDAKKRIENLTAYIEQEEEEKGKLSEIIARENEIYKGYREFLENQKTLSTLLEKQSMVEKLKREKEKIISQVEIKKRELENRLKNSKNRIDENKKAISENSKKVSKIKENLKRLLTEKEGKEKEKDRAAEEILKTKDRLSELRDKLTEKSALISSKEKILSEANGRKESALKQQKALKEKMEKLLREKTQYENIPQSKGIKTELEKLKKEENKLTEQLENLKEQKSRSEADLKYIKEKVKEITEKEELIRKETTNRCPLCGSPLTEEHKNEIKQKYRNEREELEQKIKGTFLKINNLKEDLETATALLKENSRKAAEKEKLISESISAESALQGINKQINENETEFKEIESLLKTDFLKDKEKAELNEIESKINALKDASKDTVKEQEELLSEKEKALKEIEKALHTLEKSVVKNNERADALGKQNEKLEEEIAELEQNLSETESTLKNPDFQKEEKEKIALLEKKLNETGFDEKALTECKEKNGTLSQFDKLYRELGQAKVKVKAIENSLAERKKEKEETEDILKEKEKIRDTLLEKLKEFEGLEEALKEQSEIFQHVSADFSEAVSKKAVLEEKLHTLNEKKERLKMLSAEIAEKEHKKKILTVCKNMFGRDGIQIAIIRDALPEIENIANDMLGRMTGNRMSLKFDTLKQLKSRDKTVNTLEISVFDNGEKRHYELFSGGEQFRINLAIRIGISMYLSEVNGKPLEMLVIDEGFGSQDENGKMRILEEINSFKDKFKKIIVITHVSDIKENFPYEIRVVKDAFSSRILVV